MEIDWAIGLGVFLVFTAWAFTFYGQIFSPEERGVGEALEKISTKIVENLTVKVHSVPVKLTAGEAVSNAVFWFEYRWPFGKNTTKVFKDGSSQSCNITGNKLYWRSSVSAGANEFRVKYSQQAANLSSCTGGFAVVNETQVIPLAAEEEESISLSRVNSMSSTNLSAFKDSLGINRNFNITITNASGTVVSYGLIPPRQTDVFSKKLASTLEETDGNLTIRILAW